MANEEKVDTETTEKDSEVSEVEETETNESEESEEAERPKETSENRKARLERQLKQVNKKLGIETEEKPKPKVESKKSDEFDEGQLAYLLAKGIESDEDINFTQSELKKHGGNLRELFGNEYFKSQMTARKEAKVTLDATPSNSRRTNSRPADAIEHHYAKYQKEGSDYLKTVDRETRLKIVNMRLKKETVDNEFSE